MRLVSPLYIEMATQELFSHPHLTSTAQLKLFLEALESPRGPELMDGIVGLSLEDRARQMEKHAGRNPWKNHSKKA